MNRKILVSNGFENTSVRKKSSLFGFNLKSIHLLNTFSNLRKNDVGYLSSIFNRMAYSTELQNSTRNAIF